MFAAFLVLASSALTVTDVSGVEHTIPARAAKETVLLFVGVDCPIANRMAPEISRIVKDYTPRSVEILLVYPERTLKPKDVKAHLKSYGIQSSAVIDRQHVLVKTYKAVVTPQAIIIDPSGKVRYTGRINDLYEEHGKIKPKPTRNDLRVALDELLAGKAVSNPTTQTVGCFIAEN